MIDTRIDNVILGITVLVQIDCFEVVQKSLEKKNLHYFLLYLPCGKTELYKRVYKQCSEFLEKPNRSRGLVGQPRRIRRHFDCECSRGSSGESHGWRGHIPGRTHCDMLDRWASTNTEKKKKKVLIYSETNKARAHISTLVLYNVAFWKNKNISRAHCCPMYSRMAKRRIESSFKSNGIFEQYPKSSPWFQSNHSTTVLTLLSFSRLWQAWQNLKPQKKGSFTWTKIDDIIFFWKTNKQKPT